MKLVSSFANFKYTGGICEAYQIYVGKGAEVVNKFTTLCVISIDSSGSPLLLINRRVIPY